MTRGACQVNSEIIFAKTERPSREKRCLAPLIVHICAAGRHIILFFTLSFTCLDNFKHNTACLSHCRVKNYSDSMFKIPVAILRGIRHDGDGDCDGGDSDGGYERA